MLKNSLPPLFKSIDLSDMTAFNQHQKKALKEAWKKNAIAQLVGLAKLTYALPQLSIL